MSDKLATRGQLVIPNFNLELTLYGGQAFNWIRIGNKHFGVFQDKVIKLMYKDPILYWHSSKPIEENIILEYFDYFTDYQCIYGQILQDESLSKLQHAYSGIRLLKQNLWQTIVSFVVSQNNNIPKIKTSLDKLAKLNKRVIHFDNRSFYAFPTIDELLKMSEQELQACSLGYRSKYLYLVTQSVAKTELLYQTNISYKTLRKSLLDMYGIGEKVADCILVFGYGVRNLAPIDIWVRRGAIETFNLSPRSTYKQIQHYLVSKFGEYTAYAAQILFESFRLKAKQKTT
ncbi:MAG: DNA glycosylase [Candidatus Dojkabacteria bacterium]|nr:MAG: DNA glycosylase [Candidatus Dojkabacteria bacterium]